MTVTDSKIYGPDTMRKEPGRIVGQGMGGFLNPPGHPEHTRSVETDLRRRPENRGRLSLSYAVTCEWLDAGIRARAKAILDHWQTNDRLCLGLPEMQDWIKQVLGYFRGCYVGQDKQGNPSWNADSLRINKDADPVLNADLHAGVHFIRKYYPEYVPTAEDFGGAYWGTKPEGKP